MKALEARERVRADPVNGGVRDNWVQDKTPVVRPCVMTVTTKKSRSEEHTSELQSLMRISYAVFCLKKKKHHIKKTRLHTEQKRNTKHDAQQPHILILLQTYHDISQYA